METEERILLAAVEQFKAHGFSGATTKAIAAEAGVAEITLFRYFGDKKTLFMRAAAYIGEEFGLMNIPGRRSGDFRQDIVGLCRSLLHHFIRQNALIRMLIFEVMKYEDTRSILTDIRRKAMDNIMRLVCEYRECNDGGHAGESIEWLLSSLIGSSLSYMLFHQTDDENAYVLSQAGMIADAFADRILTAGK